MIRQQLGSLLKLISVILMLPTLISLVQAGTYCSVIESFETATGWTCDVDWSAPTASNTQVDEGSYSLRVLAEDNIHLGTCGKAGYSINVSNLNYSYISLWEDTWPQTENVNITFSSPTKTCVLDDKTGITGNVWNYLSWDSISETDCSAADWVTLDDFTVMNLTGYFSEYGTYIYWDNLTLCFNQKQDSEGCSLDEECLGGYCCNSLCSSTPCDSCTAPASGDWEIINGDKCTLNVADTITGNLELTDGGLEIQASGALTVSGGYIYIYSGSNLTMLSGGQING